MVNLLHECDEKNGGTGKQSTGRQADIVFFCFGVVLLNPARGPFLSETQEREHAKHRHSMGAHRGNVAVELDYEQACGSS